MSGELMSIADSVEDQEEFPQPSVIDENAIRRLNREGGREGNEQLRIIGESREALAKMPEGSFGVVLGSGGNTAEWRERGWLTLDVNPGSGADYIRDANYLEGFFAPESLDYLYAENIAFDKSAKKGVHSTRLLNQANVVLKQHGKLIIKSGHSEGNVGTLPDRREFEGKMTKEGFHTVTELSRKQVKAVDGIERQHLVYYGEKLGEGHSTGRLK